MFYFRRNLPCFEIKLAFHSAVVTSAHWVVPFYADPESVMSLNLMKNKEDKI